MRRYRFLPLTMPTVLVTCVQVLIALSMNGCGDKTVIIGEVKDGFENPLAGVKISVQGTTFKTQTDAKGNYSVPYVPGKFKISYIKQGYTTDELNFEISAESTYPAQILTLYKIPVDKGIFLFGNADYKKLGSGKVVKRQKKFKTKGFRGLKTQDVYSVFGEFTTIKGKQKLTFLDNDNIAQSLYKLDENFVYFTINSYWGDTKLVYEFIKDEFKEIQKGIYIREVTLEQEGRYAFVTQQDKSGRTIWPVLEPLYLFELSQQNNNPN